MLIEINSNNRIEIAPEAWTDHCRSIPGARWSKESRCWHFPLTFAACKQLRAVFKDRLEIGPLLRNWAENELATRITPSLEIRDAIDAPAIQGYPLAFSFQNAGARFMALAGQCLLSDPLGAGKTLQCIMALQLLNKDAFPVLVICPNTLKINWKREFNKWAPDISVHIVNGTATQRNKVFHAFNGDASHDKVLIINIESTRIHSRLTGYGSIALTPKETAPKELNFIDWGTVIVDEAHRLKNPKAKQTRAVWAVSKHAKYRFALTGTPLTNAPDTLFPILHFLSPEEWPSKTQFIDRYCLSGFNSFGGLEVFGIRPDMAKEFFSIFDPRFRRMPKEVILPNLPPIIHEQRFVQMSPKQRKAYEDMTDSLCTETEDGTWVIAQNPIAQLTRLSQFASCYVENDEGHLILSDPSCKLDAFMDDVDDWISAGEPIVVFAQSRQLLRMASARLSKANIEHTIVEGGQTQDQRQQSVDLFQAGKVPCILVVLAVGSQGLNLTRSRVSIFLQRPWSYVEYEQACGRTHRIGSENHPNILYIDYITEGTVELRQLDVLANKENLLQEILRDNSKIKQLIKGTV